MRSGRSDRNKNTSKFISLILRHKPETIGITLDFRARCARWTGENTLFRLMHRGAACQWQALSTDRAGRRDLIPKSRLYVHLSLDKETAKKVGIRHGRPVIYEIDCRQMAADGYRFFESANHAWLTKEVPVKYLKKKK